MSAGHCLLFTPVLPNQPAFQKCSHASSFLHFISALCCITYPSSLSTLNVQFYQIDLDRCEGETVVAFLVVWKVEKYMILDEVEWMKFKSEFWHYWCVCHVICFLHLIKQVSNDVSDQRIIAFKCSVVYNCSHMFQIYL